MSVTQDTNGDFRYTRYSEWEAAANRKGLDGPYSVGTKLVFLRGTDQKEAAVWQGDTGVIYK